MLMFDNWSQARILFPSEFFRETTWLRNHSWNFVPQKISMNRSQSRISNTCKSHRKFPKLKNRYRNSFDRSTLKKRRLIPEFHGPSQKRKSSSSNHPFFSAQFLCFREGIHPQKKNWRNRPWIGPDDWKKDPFLSKWSLFEGLCGYVKLWGAVPLSFDGACGPWHVRAARLSSCSAPVKCPTFIWATAFGGGGFGKVRGGCFNFGSSFYWKNHHHHHHHHHHHQR